MRPGGRAIFTDHQRFPMRGGVVVAREQPLRVDCKFIHECGYDVDEQQRVDQLVVIVDQRPELGWSNEQRGRKRVKRFERLT